MRKNNKYYQGFDFGIILKYINNKFYANYNSDPGSSGGAIFLKKNHKVIGIHKGGKYSSIFGMKVNGIIPINIILEDMKINLESQRTQINEDLPRSLQPNQANNHEALERALNLTKDMTFYLKCKHCGQKYGDREFNSGSFGWVKELDEKFSLFDPCSNCGKEGHEYVVPYVLDVKCLECGNIILEKYPLGAYVIFIEYLKVFKPCDKCGKQNYTIVHRREEDQ